jgi:hypothetical protein
MVPTNCRAASRGSCVSVSRVMTYRTPDRTRVADDERKAVPGERPAPPRSSAFRSASLPRLRS